jgi:Zn-dependent protease
MNWSIKLGKIKGIDIKVHLTFILILVWAAYQWGVSTGKGLEGALFGVVVTLLLFLCVTLHELGHSFQALRFGIPVKDITLWPFGGLAQIERMPEKPRQELLIAIAGPLVNLVIGFGLLLVSQVLQIQGWLAIDQLFQVLGDVSWQGLLAYLIMANFALALFNLLPAFPMDGGRVLRALLAMRMDHAKATRWAVGIGQTLAWGLGLWGFTSGGYTLILIAIFVYLAAGQEGKTSAIKNVLGDLKVAPGADPHPGRAVAARHGTHLANHTSRLPGSGKRTIGRLSDRKRSADWFAESRPRSAGAGVYAQ